MVTKEIARELARELASRRDRQLPVPEGVGTPGQRKRNHSPEHIILVSTEEIEERPNIKSLLHRGNAYVKQGACICT